MTNFDEIHGSAGHARAVYSRLSGEGGILQQIESGEWDARLRDSTEIAALLEAMAERGRLDRIFLDLLAPAHYGS